MFVKRMNQLRKRLGKSDLNVALININQGQMCSCRRRVGARDRIVGIGQMFFFKTWYTFVTSHLSTNRLL